MSDDQNNDDNGNNASNEDLKGQLSDLQDKLTAATAESESMKSKMDTLLNETKEAKQAKRDIEQAATQAANDKAKADGDFEQLHRSSEEARAGLESQLTDLRDSIANEKRDGAAMRLAGEIADGFNAEMLSEHIGRRLKWTDGGLKVTDVAGNLTVTTIEELKTEFQGNERYASLLKGNQSSGGSASGGDGGSGQSKMISRAEFDKQGPEAKMKFIRNGGTVHD